MAEPQTPEDMEEIKRRHLHWQSFVDLRGILYAECRVSNFVATTPKQKSAVKEITQYINELPDRVAAGEGIVLFGTRGTGKDHLMSAVSRVAILRDGLEVTYVFGMDLFGERRDRIRADESEESFVRRYASCPILYVADPLPPSGALSADQQVMLARILDRRYSNQRTTWITINVLDRNELDERIGYQIADRIVDRSLTLNCSWKSNRGAKK